MYDHYMHRNTGLEQNKMYKFVVANEEKLVYWAM